MIVYGVLADVSIGKLFIAGILPGLLLATSYSVYIMVVALLDKRVVPSTKESYTWKDRAYALKELAPVLGLITVVIGSIYAGIATPTEAAALGVACSIGWPLYFKSLTFSIFKLALLNTIKTTVMISFIIAGALFYRKL